ncbi:MAG: DUF429 domain-containing protein [Trueperaceae bacterium]|nr:DUF429 domain-containing protein [Trueperaceae bacterium]
MQIYGVDFTSVPSRRKPLTVAVAALFEEGLELRELLRLTSFTEFETLLAERSGVAGIDAPFGQPRRLIQALDWPLSWPDYVTHLAGFDKQTFVTTLDDYTARQPPGDKHHRRVCDERVGAQSPMMLYGVPVAKMFFALAPRLLAAPVDIPLLRPNKDAALSVVEVYPALVVRALVGKRKYKNGDDGGRRGARALLVSALANDNRYGLRVAIPRNLANDLVDDASGDLLDAVLATLPTAWSSRTPNGGIPPEADPCEGWIVDPESLEPS